MVGADANISITGQVIFTPHDANIYLEPEKVPANREDDKTHTSHEAAYIITKQLSGGMAIII